MKKSRRAAAALLAGLLCLSPLGAAAEELPAQPLGAVEDAPADLLAATVDMRLTIANEKIAAEGLYTLVAVPRDAVWEASLNGDTLLYIDTATAATPGVVAYPEVRLRRPIPADFYLTGTGFDGPTKVTWPNGDGMDSSTTFRGTVKDCGVANSGSGTVYLVDGISGHTYWEDGMAVGADKGYSRQVAPGNYKLRIEKKGYLTSFAPYITPVAPGSPLVEKPELNISAHVGDVNNDGRRNAADLKVLTENLGKAEAEWTKDSTPDLNGDKTVDVLDFDLLQPRLTPAAVTPAPALSVTDSTVTGDGVTGTVHKLIMTLDQGPTAFGFQLGYDNRVVVPCTPLGVPCTEADPAVAVKDALVSPADGYTVLGGTWDQTGAQISTVEGKVATGVVTAGEKQLVEFYYTFLDGKTEADLYNGIFFFQTAWAGLTEPAYVRYGADPANTLNLTGFVYPNSTLKCFKTLTVSGGTTVEATHTLGDKKNEVRSVDLTVAAKMEDGGVVNLPADLTWAIAGEPLPGVTLTARSGNATLQVTHEAQEGTVTVSAVSGDVRAEHTITITKEPYVPVADTIKIKKDGIDCATDTLAATAGRTTTRAYSASVYDKHGLPMPSTGLIWSQEGAWPSGITLSDGALTVGSSVGAGKYAVKVTASLGSVQDTLSVGITVKTLPPTPTPTLPPTPTPTLPPTPTPPPLPPDGGGGGGGGGGNIGGGGLPPTDLPATLHGRQPVLTLTPNAVADATGGYTATLTQAEGAALVSAAGGGGLLVISPVVTGSASAVAVDMTGATLAALAGGGGNFLAVNTALGRVDLNPAALKALEAAGGQKVTLGVARAAGDSGALDVTVAADGKPVQNLRGGVTLTAPLTAAQTAPGTVAVLVGADGKETVLPKSALVDGKLVVPLEGAATVMFKNLAVPFGDMKDHWAAGSAAFASARGLFTGTREKVFDPDLNMTRGMVATVLHRMEQEPAVTTAMHFEDVPPGAWYEKGMAWAAEMGIIIGSGGQATPAADVTREQLAAMFYRYAKVLGLDLTPRGNLETFQDGGAVSPWSADAMSWAVAEGIFTGRTSDLLDPGGTAQRAEVATLLERFTATAARQR